MTGATTPLGAIEVSRKLPSSGRQSPPARQPPSPVRVLPGTDRLLEQLLMAKLTPTNSISALAEGDPDLQRRDRPHLHHQ